LSFSQNYHKLVNFLARFSQPFDTIGSENKPLHTGRQDISSQGEMDERLSKQGFRKIHSEHQFIITP
jgi:hypothetical protein